MSDVGTLSHIYANVYSTNRTHDIGVGTLIIIIIAYVLDQWFPAFSSPRNC